MQLENISEDKPLVSIIIPVYKVEKYIEKCIRSVINQTFKNFEVIIVDDGSPDKSTELAKKIVGDDKRFIFLEKENGGLSSARNLGLDYARSDYVCFIDSDDYVEENYLEELYSNAVSSNADIVACKIRLVDEYGISIQLHKTLKFGDYSSKEIFPLAIESTVFSPAAWNKIYKKKLFSKICYPDGIYYEDFAIMYKLIFMSKKIKLIDDVLYNYVQRNHSIMATYSSLHVKSRFNIFNDMKDFLESKKIYEQYQENYNRSYLTHYVCRAIYEIMMDNSNYLIFKNKLKDFLDKIDLDILNFKGIVKYLKISFSRGGGLLVVKMSPYLAFKMFNLYRTVKFYAKKF